MTPHYIPMPSNTINLKNILLFIISILLFTSNNLSAQTSSPFSGLEHLFTKPKSYILYHAESPLKIDGELDEKAWTAAPWSEYFGDIEGDIRPAPAHKTRVKMLWDDKYIYIAAQIEEPHIWANKRPEQDKIFRDNVFKIFIDPDNSMNDDFEMQINPQNNMLFLIMNKPYRDSGIPVTGWVPIGLQSAVKINGTINNSSDTDSDWIAEIAIPLASLNFNPRDAKQNEGLRLNFLRTGFDFTVKDGIYSKALDSAGKAFPPHYASWSSQGLINMHYPERWGYTVFSGNSPENKTAEFILPYSEKQRAYLWLAYYRQKDWQKKNKTYAGSLQQLNIPENDIIIDGRKNQLKQEATDRQFLVTISDEDGKSSQTINQDGAIVSGNR